MNERTAAVLVDLLIRGSDLLSKWPLIDIDPFIAYFVDKAGGSGLSLQALMGEFEEAVLQNVDVATGRFMPPFQVEKDTRRAQVHRRLRALVTAPDAANGRGLIQELALRYRRGVRVHELLIAVARSSAAIPNEDGIDRSHLSHAFAWCARLLTSLDRLFDCARHELSLDLEPDLLLVEIDRLTTDFVEAANSEAPDPLSDLWSDISSRSTAFWSTDYDSTAQRNLLQALWERLCRSEPTASWVLRLRAVLSSSALKEQRLVLSPPMVTPLSFDEHVGNAGVIQALQDRLTGCDHATALILHGPAGVGKGDIARIYGRIYLCEHRHGGLSACGRIECDPCTGFDHGGGFEFIDFDCDGDDPEGRALRLRERVDNCPFADRLFVLVRNIEQYPAVIGPLLKVLERASDFVTFAFCVTDIRAMSDAGRSRCRIYRIRELDEADARRLASRLIGSEELSGEVMANIVHCGGGHPDRIRNACARISASGDFSIDVLKSVLGQDNASWAIGYLARLLNPDCSFDDVMSPATSLGAAASIQSIIDVQVELWRIGQGVDTQSLFEAGQMNRLLTQFRLGARERGLTFGQLWSDLARIWSTANASVPDELAALTCASRQHLFSESYPS